MSAKNGGRKWTAEEEATLRRVWMNMRALGAKPVTVIRHLMELLGRSRASISSKADYL